MPPAHDSPISPEKFLKHAQAIEEQIGRVIVGQREVIRHVLIAVIAGGHVLLEGVPGLGKTMLIRTLADTLDLSFSRIQFTPDLMPADITGTEILVDEDGRRRFHFQHGPLFANLILADEINRATPKTQSALLEAMQESMVTVAEQTYILEQPFFVMATQNPLEMEGTYPLPEAQLDRFLFKVNVEFPAQDDLVQIFARTTGAQQDQASAVVDRQTILAMRALGREVPIATHVQQTVAQIVLASHPEHALAPEMVRRFVRYGASPRAGQAIILGAKVRALIEGRFNVAFEDLFALTPAALRHRLLLNFDALAEGIQPDSILQTVVETQMQRLEGDHA